MGWGSFLRLFGLGDQKPPVIETKTDKPPPKPSRRPRDAHCFSRRYNEIMRVGHNSPPPVFGAPTLIWHIALWPERECDPNAEGVEPGNFEKRRGHFAGIVQNVLDTLARKGRHPKVPEESWERMGLEEVKSLEEEEEGEALRKASPRLYKIVEPQSVCFTIWWKRRSAAADATLADAAPAESIPEEALRVHVQSEMLMDHATISIFIDAGKPWNKPPVYTAAEAGGGLRGEIFGHAEYIRSVCERNGRREVEQELLPENGVSGWEREKLLGAADYLYNSVWDEFRRDFGLNFDTLLGEGDVQACIFGSFRGLVLSADGYETEGLSGSDRLARRIANANRGREAFDRFNQEKNEPNYVLKAYWPFIRRTTRWADYKEFVACGVMDWRALFVTSLGARRPMRGTAEGAMADAIFASDESASRDAEIGGEAHLPETLRGPGSHAPLRYLLITKGEPNRRQIGRIVERVNLLETMRLFALKDWAAIRNASDHVRALGQDLNDVLTNWMEQRTKIGLKFQHLEQKEKQALMLEEKIAHLQSKRFSLRRILTTRTRKGILLRKRNEIQMERDKQIEQLQEENNLAELNLITISSKLDRLSRTATGGISYCIARSELHFKRYYTMIDRLNSGYIPTWLPYRTFAERNLRPYSEFISGVGERLRALRQRLQAVTTSVQTAALVNQTSATRSNTAALREIANQWMLTQVGVAGGILAVIYLLGKGLYFMFGNLCSLPILNLFPFCH